MGSNAMASVVEMLPLGLLWCKSVGKGMNMRSGIQTDVKLEVGLGA